MSIVDNFAVNTFDSDGTYIETTYVNEGETYRVDDNGNIQVILSPMTTTTDTLRSRDYLYSDASATVIVY